jgi:hypothetical protein
MNGQWLGKYTGTNSGSLVIDFDDMGTHYEGCAFAYDDNNSMSASFIYTKTPDKSGIFELCLDILPVNPRTGDPVPSWDQVAALFPPTITFPRRVTVNVSLEEKGKTLRVSWKTDIGTFGSAALPKSRAGEPSEYKPHPDVSNWEQFKLPPYPARAGCATVAGSRRMRLAPAASVPALS